MPSYTLHYFDVRGRAELSRLIFHAAGIPFTDKRYISQDWQAQKPHTPLGQLPYLDVDNVQLPQSISISRYIAKEGNLAGQTSLEQAKADAIVDTCMDAFNVYVEVVYHTPEPKREEAIKAYTSEAVPKHVRNIEKLVGLYGKDGYAVGDSLTWADLIIYDLASNFEITFKISLHETHPVFAANKKICEEHAKLGPYLKSRA